VHLRHLAAKVAGIQLESPDHFVDAAKIGNGERFFAERRRDRRVLELPSSPLPRIAKNHRMVECQEVAGQRIVDRHQQRLACVTSRNQSFQLRHQREVRRRYDAAAWITFWVAVSVQLLEMKTRTVQPRLLAKLTQRGLVKGFLALEVAPRKR